MKTTFNYTAKTHKGNHISGKVLAESHEDAHDYLSDQNYIEINVKRHFEVDEL